MKALRNILLIITLISSTLTFAQEQNQLSKYTLISDRNCYISGDYVFVSVFVTEYCNDLAMYVDLATTANEFIKGEILHLNSGFATGYIQIPDTLKTGSFNLRAYTFSSNKYTKQRTLATKEIFVSNRFGNNGVLLQFEKRINKPDSIFETEELLNDSFEMLFDKEDFAKRSKVTVVVQPRTAINELLEQAVFTVKPVSKCELQNCSISTSQFNISLHEKSTENPEFKNENALHENKGLVISGQAIHKVTKNALADVLILMAFEDSVLRLKYSITDSLGRFSFMVSNCYGEQDVFLSSYSYPKMEVLSHVNLVIDSKFVNGKNTTSNANVLGYQQSTDSLNLKKSIINKAYGIQHFKITDTINRVDYSYEHEFLAGDFSRITQIDDYIKLPDFYQIAREILPFVKIKMKDGNYDFMVFDGQNNLVRNNPMVLVDGVPLTEKKAISEWGTDKLKKIEVKVDSRYYGDLPFENGLILIWTRDLDFWPNNDCENTQKFTVPCFQPQVTFNFPNYSKGNTNTLTPDFRQVLFWESNIELRPADYFETEFYTSDEMGLFEANFFGRTKNNKLIFIRKYFKVK